MTAVMEPPPMQRARRGDIRDCLRCAAPFALKHNLKVVFCSKRCAAVFRNPRRFDPSADELIALLRELPQQKIAEKFGVSDSAIVKRRKALGIFRNQRGIWAAREVGKVDADGNRVFTMILCSCGCGAEVEKWGGRGVGGRRRRGYEGHGHNQYNNPTDRAYRQREAELKAFMREHAVAWREERDLNVYARRECRRERLDAMTAAAVRAVESITERFFAQHLGAAWLAVRERWHDAMTDAEARVVALDAVIGAWRESNPHWGERSLQSENYEGSEIGNALDLEGLRTAMIEVSRAWDAPVTP